MASGFGRMAATHGGGGGSSGGSPVEPHHQAGAMLLPSPVSTPSSDSASAAAAAQVSVPAYDDDSFAPQLIDNSYSVFSPPTFLYGLHGEL